MYSPSILNSMDIRNMDYIVLDKDMGMAQGMDNRHSRRLDLPMLLSSNHLISRQQMVHQDIHRGGVLHGSLRNTRHDDLRGVRHDDRHDIRRDVRHDDLHDIRRDDRHDIRRDALRDVRHIVLDPS